MTCIYGVDFTSRPTARKPITCAVGILHDQHLTITRIEALPNMANFAALLQRPGPWVAGFDFPFGQPLELLDWLHTQHHWPREWQGFIEQVSRQSLTEFGSLLAAFRQTRGSLPKNAKRAVDLQARSISSMMMAYVPVGKMFFWGVPALMRADVCIVPCRMTSSDRVAIEAYPALVARAIIGNQSYKNDHDQAQRHTIRQQLMDDLCDPHGLIAVRYGITLICHQSIQDACRNDSSGDTLDAVLAALQAAWASNQPNYGIPAGHEYEGWIADPTTQYE